MVTPTLRPATLPVDETEDNGVSPADRALPPFVMADDNRLKLPPSEINLRFVRSEKGSTAISGRFLSVIFGFGSALN